MTVTAGEFLHRSYCTRCLAVSFVSALSASWPIVSVGALLTLCRHLPESDTRRRSPSQATAGKPTCGGRICPLCGGPMMVIERLTAQQICRESIGQKALDDTS